MAGLTINQFEIELDKIYKLEKFSDDFEYRTPSIFIKGTGNANIYTDEELPAVKGDMQLEHEEVINHNAFLTIPNYIYVEEANATVSTVILTGIKPTEVV